MRILLLSDLHIGENAIDKSLNPYKDISNPLLLDSFYKTINTEEKSKPFDILIIPGDFTNKSFLVEYHVGQNFIEELFTKVNFKHKEYVFVPGNHDIDWSIFKGIPAKEKERRKHHKYNTLIDKSHNLSGDAVFSLTQEPFIRKWEYDDFVVLGFNSAWHDDALKDDHYGIILDSHLGILEEHFKKLDAKKSKFFIIHHHLLNYKNPRADWLDFSALQNAEALLDLLHKYDFDFVFTGHRHVPNFRRLNRSDLKPLNVLCCGSFSCEIHSSISGIVRNTFHIVDIDKKSSGTCQGNVYSYEFHQSKGWIKCNDQSNIQFKNPFGYKGQLPLALTKLKNVVSELFKSKTLIKWSEIVNEIPSMKYLTIDAKDKLSLQLCEKLNCVKFKQDTDIYFIKES